MACAFGVRGRSYAAPQTSLFFQLTGLESLFSPNNIYSSSKEKVMKVDHQRENALNNLL